MGETLICETEKLLQAIHAGQDVRIRVWKRKVGRANKAGHRAEQTLGLCVYCVDNAQFKCRRMKYLHVSTRDLTELESWVLRCNEHIFSTDPSTEIMVDLVHSPDEEGKKRVWPLMKDLMTTLKFKWRMTVNDKKLGRCTIYALQRDLEKHPQREA